MASGGSGLFNSFGMDNQNDILDVDEAFKLSTETTASSFIANFRIAEGHYLYRDKVKITVDDTDVQAGALQLPAGDSKDDPIFNKITNIKT